MDEAGTSLAALDIHTGDYKPFGRIEDFGSPNKNMMMNKHHVFVDGERIISVPLSIPRIEVYDKRTLESIGSCDLLHLPQIRAIYNRMQNDPKMAGPNNFYFLLRDAWLNGRELYLLVNVYENDLLHTEVLVLDIRKEMKLKQQYRFDEKTAVGSLCSTNDYIYASTPQTGTIRRYPLK